MTQRSIALITGACGGMGQAAARRLGGEYRLALSDIDQGRVDALATTLEGEGHDVVARHAGDYAQRGVATAAVAAARAAGPLGAVVHTAGLSPSLAEWDRIVLTNIVATEELLQAIESDTSDALTAVLIASLAAHTAAGKPQPELDALFDDALREDVLAKAGPLIAALAPQGNPKGAGMPAYSYSKFAVMRLTARRAAPWAKLGRRIMTISPGVVDTPMGLKEQADNPAARAAADAQPITPITGDDIANAIAFLVSDDARTITGSDLLVDGGVASTRKYL